MSLCIFTRQSATSKSVILNTKHIITIMKLFQSAGFGSSYLTAFNSNILVSEVASFDARKHALLKDCYAASHILKPVYDGDPNCFFTVCDDPILQMLWARENGLGASNLADILLAQIEEFQPDVFYQLDPILFPSSFVRRLPGCVKKVVAWRAAPIGAADLTAYDVVLSNFETLNARWREKGLHTAWFSPSWDPEMAPYAEISDRPVDVFFTGSYARTTGHDDRLAMLDAVAQLSDLYHIDLRLMSRKWGRLADKPLLRWIPVPIRLPQSLRFTTNKPVYGREMYATLSRAKILLNPATDIAGEIRGNMRCWEALGCGACMLGSAGEYPEGFEPGVNFEVFVDAEDLKRKINLLLADDSRRVAIAKAGADMLTRIWSKERQWNDFVFLVSKL